MSAALTTKKAKNIYGQEFDILDPKKHEDSVELAAITGEIENIGDAITALPSISDFITNTPAGKEAQRFEDAFNEKLDNGGVTLEEIQGLNNEFDRLFAPYFNTLAKNLTASLDIKYGYNELAHQPENSFDMSRNISEENERYAKLFASCDKDGDGKLNRAEYQALQDAESAMSLAEAMTEFVELSSKQVSPLDIELPSEAPELSS